MVTSGSSQLRSSHSATDRHLSAYFALIAVGRARNYVLQKCLADAPAADILSSVAALSCSASEISTPPRCFVHHLPGRWRQARIWSTDLGGFELVCHLRLVAGHTLGAGQIQFSNIE